MASSIYSVKRMDICDNGKNNIKKKKRAEERKMKDKIISIQFRRNRFKYLSRTVIYSLREKNFFFLIWNTIWNFIIRSKIEDR